MANLRFVDGAGDDAKYRKATGVGSDADPFITSVIVDDITPGTGATDLGKAEDAAHTSGDVGVMALTVRQNTAAALSGTDADYQPLITDTNGRLHVIEPSASGAATSLALLDDVVKTDDTGFTPASDKVLMVGAQADETAPDSVTEGDAGALRMTLDRKLHSVVEMETATMRAGASTLTPAFAVVDVATSGDNLIVTNPNAGQKIRVLAFFLVASAAVTVRFESDASGAARSGAMQLAANGGFVLPFSPVGWFETAADADLNLELSGNISVDGGVVYVLV